MGVWSTRRWQTSGQLVQELNVCTVSITPLQHVYILHCSYSLHVAVGALEAIKYAHRFGVKVGKAIARFTLGGILDVNSITFDVRLAAANTGQFAGSMKARIVGKNLSFNFNLKIRSISSMVNSLINKCKTEIEKVFK